jgi:hypothetical protein
LNFRVANLVFFKGAGFLILDSPFFRWPIPIWPFFVRLSSTGTLAYVDLRAAASSNLQFVAGVTIVKTAQASVPVLLGACWRGLQPVGGVLAGIKTHRLKPAPLKTASFTRMVKGAALENSTLT